MTFSAAVEEFLRRSRANGLAYRNQEWLLAAFRRYVNDSVISEITPNQVAEFLSCRRYSAGRWADIHRCLRKFFEFCTDRGFMLELAMPQQAKGCKNNDGPRAPFIYTQSELRSLIRATHGSQAAGKCAMSEDTLRAILITLYGTGATVSEILWLRRDDLDLKRNLIFLRGNMVIRERRVPLNKDLRELLVNYRRAEDRRGASNSLFFVSKLGDPIAAPVMFSAFARLRIRAGVVRVDKRVGQPRMCDLRGTFAAHRIASWVREGSDLNRMLPALAAYMGYSCPDPLQRLLRITPERFRRELDTLSPFRLRKHWRDDPELMEFLAHL